MEIKDLASLVTFSKEKMRKIEVFPTQRMRYDLYTLLPGQAQRPHVHPEAEKVYYALEGEVMLRVGDEEALLPEGSAGYVPAGAVHGVKNISASPAVLLVVMAPREGASKTT